MMDAITTSLSRQSGLMTEMQTIANNIANANTAGFRSAGITFSEFLNSAGSVSMSAARAHHFSVSQGALAQTGGTYDLAIEGDGFFLVETPEGQRLTRAGNFTPNEMGDLVTMDGHPVLDSGGAPVFVPIGAGSVGIAPDGTISADGQIVGQVGIWQPADPLTMRRTEGTRFAADGYEPAEGRMVQGFVEQSNVDPILQISRLIEVQRAYELGQSFSEREDERVRNALGTITR
ncbi:flagellar hook-basal body complex protein [Marivivens donghaensis]|uniref:Flagellar basal-body rod protein FlgF n=1 Tax=Marivivens donghaensis TaxID=1699413 RepID=A0ABX0W339_9RHOB|nr:flagellar hook-basal body complex protein [Marivivens donghaensis]NIY73303.1 flagellar hook-basal body complex protein [Marivivens donghaensis]